MDAYALTHSSLRLWLQLYPYATRVTRPAMKRTRGSRTRLSDFYFSSHNIDTESSINTHINILRECAQADR